MIEAVTPQIVTVSLFLIVVSAPILSMLLSALLLSRYRRAVMREMGAMSDIGAQEPAASPPAGQPAIGGDGGSHHLYQRAIRGPWYGAMHYAAAGFVSAAVFALAARFVYPVRSDLVGFLIGMWIYSWPVVLALALIVPGPKRRWAAYVGVYFFVFLLLGVWAASVTNLPEFRFGAIVVSPRSAITPSGMIRLWLVVNAGPTLLVLLCLNYWVRAVAPLVLVLMTTAISGTWIALLALFSAPGAEAAVALSMSLGLDVRWLILATVVVSLIGFGITGWVLARWMARAYRRRRVSDQSLMLDALWLLFAGSYVMWLVLGGLHWMAAAPAGFLGYKLVLTAERLMSRSRPTGTRGLTFLRVFALGRRSDALLTAVAGSWRYVGAVGMITGPDVARSTVQPHQFLDFLSGRLSRHFVRDGASLERSLVERDLVQDPDGRFRINNFFCYADTWRRVLPRLVEEGDVVLMDLRSFSAGNAGCVHELRHLAQNVSFDRCVLIVDDTTDAGFLDRTLTESWAQLSPGSPNHGRPWNEATLHRFEPGSASVRRLVRRLCEAKAG